MRLRLRFVVAPIALVVAISGPIPVCGQTRLPWASAAPQTAHAADSITDGQLPLARVRLEGGSATWVGQAVPIVIEVIVPSWFTGAPAFPDLEVPNAVTLSPEPVWNFTVPSGRQSFAGQARRYLVFPLAAGRYQVPPVRVTVSYSLPGGGPSAPVALPVPGAVTFDARVPAGADGARYFLTTDGFQLHQSFDRKPGAMRVGEALTRTITMTAANTVGMSIPQLRFEAPDGIRTYPGTPAVTETAERGTVAATRTEKVAYVAEKAGHYTLPAITVLWWNPKTTAMTRATAPAVVVDVEATTAYGTEVFASSQAEGERPENAAPPVRAWLGPAVRWTLAIAAAGLLIVVVSRVLSSRRHSVAAYLARRRHRRAEAEAAWFARFEKACRSQDPSAALRSVMNWIDRINEGPVVPTLTRFSSESGVDALADGTRALNELLFARRTGTEQTEERGSWSGQRYFRLVAQARKSSLAASRRVTRRAEPDADVGRSPLASRLNPDADAVRS